MNSLSLMNTSKIHLHVEQFSLKTNWRLEERLLYSQGCKERFTWNQGGREEIDQVRTHTEEQGDTPGLGILPGE